MPGAGPDRTDDDKVAAKYHIMLDRSGISLTLKARERTNDRRRRFTWVCHAVAMISV
jgi:hypothetical protein